MKTNAMTNILLAVIAVTIGVAIYAGFEKYDQYLKIKAIDDCGKISRFEKKLDEFTTVWYPDAGVYKSCLDDKGIN